MTRPEYHPSCSQWPQRRLLLLALFSKHPDIKALVGLSLCPKLGCFFFLMGVSQYLLQILWRRIRRMGIFPMRKHWILDDFGVSYFQTEGGSDHEHLGFDWKKALKTNCFCDFPWIYLPICGQFFMGKFLWFFLDPWSWDIYGNLWLRNAYTVNCPWNWGWRWTKINIWVPSLEIYPCNIMQLWIAGGSGYVSWECLGQVDLIYTGFMHSRGYEKPMRGGSGNNPGHGVWHYGAVWEF